MTALLVAVQLFFSIVIGLYFMFQLKSQQSTRNAVNHDSRREMDKLARLRQISLSKPLSEKVRPQKMDDIIGQEEGIKALRAALCGPNPQHVLIYGPPGIGKTCAARLVLGEARANRISPFGREAKFVEMDATCVRFDERSIADPLIGSVHDPIYQGAGAMGVAGIPQPKPGAVTKAHGGILFLDEIGELHPTQMNKLLKVLEDRRVFFESAYYSESDSNIPSYIHDVFKNGLPADFRLVGATTRTPSDLPAAIRSRCVEVFFRPLDDREMAQIASGAAKKAEVAMEEGCAETVGRYSANGRDAVNIVQMAAGLAVSQGRSHITLDDVEWVLNNGNYAPSHRVRVPRWPAAGVVNGMAICGPQQGAVMTIEIIAEKVAAGAGKLMLTGVLEEEEMGGEGHKVRMKSAVRSSVENVCTMLHATVGIDTADYNVHINFPGGIPVDGPSAGLAIACGLYSAVHGFKVDNLLALTGEVSIRGDIYPVGGVPAKLKAAEAAGAKRAFIPASNWQQNFDKLGIKIMPVRHFFDILNENGAFVADEPQYNSGRPAPVLSAKG
jgi:Lon-like ATP-dependent protease